MDTLADYASAVVKMLLFGHPYRTSIGVVLGVVVNTIVKIFSPAISRLSSWIDLTKITGFEYAIIGIGIAHSPSLGQLFRKKDIAFDESIEQAFAVIKEAEKHGVSADKRKLMYLALCEQVIKRVSLKPSTREEMEKIMEELTSPNPPTSA